MNRCLSWTVAACCLAAGCKSIPDELVEPPLQLARPRVVPVAKPAVPAPAPEVLLDVPLRRANALGGRAFLQRLTAMPVHLRERAIVDEVLRGNVPSHLRTLAPLTLGSVFRDGRSERVTAWVLRDYVAIGSDTDYVHVPLSYDAAVRLCAATGMALPTRRIVDAVYSQATLRLSPRPLPASRAMTSVAYLLRHDETIQEQLMPRLRALAATGTRALVAGHKKDVVVSKRLVRRPDRLAIFGWHQQGAEPIQPLSLAHDRGYADYSHGIRLVANAVKVGERLVPIDRAFADPELSAFVSDEGRFPAFAAVAGLERR